MDRDGVLGLEDLLRDTLGRLFEQTLGVDWQQRLSRRTAKALENDHHKAQHSRTGVPDDPWLASGLATIGQIAQHFLRELDGQATAVVTATDPDGRLWQGLIDLGWHSVELCHADMERLVPTRDDAAHPGVVPPLSSAMNEEVAAITKRIRLGCEKIRRDLMQLDDDWFPYIESATCPGVEEWQFERGRKEPRLARLNEGDDLEVIVRAINTEGSDSKLRFGLFVQAEGGSFAQVVDDTDDGHLAFRAAPPGRNVMFRVSVRADSGGHDASGWDDHIILGANVRPARIAADPPPGPATAREGWRWGG